MATEQGWRDFDRVISTIERAKDAIRIINDAINDLQFLKTEIMDDTTRRSEMREIIDIHPDHTIASLQNMFQKMIDLQTFLEDNGYI